MISPMVGNAARVKRIFKSPLFSKSIYASVRFQITGDNRPRSGIWQPKDDISVPDPINNNLKEIRNDDYLLFFGVAAQFHLWADLIYQYFNFATLHESAVPYK